MGTWHSISNFLQSTRFASNVHLSICSVSFAGETLIDSFALLCFIPGLAALLAASHGQAEQLNKQDLLDDLLEQAKAARDVERSDEGRPLSPSETGSSSMLDHLLNKAMEEKVSRESDPSHPQANYHTDSASTLTEIQDQMERNEKSRFKYLFFEILTPDEYNDIVYLGEDLLEPIEEDFKFKEKDQYNGEKYVDRNDNEHMTKTYAEMNSNDRKSSPESIKHLNTYSEVDKNEGEIVDERKLKMESLLKRMSERYQSRKGDQTDTSASEESKTRKLKTMIDVLKSKLDNYETNSVKREPSASRRTDSDLDTSRPIQRTRTTPTTIRQQADKNFYTTKEPIKHSNEDSIKTKEKWESAMDELSSKIRKMSSGIHRLNLEEMLDLDLLQVPENDQKSSDSLPRTTSVPKFNYDSKLLSKNVPKRQVNIHPKLTFQRPDIGVAHRPSMNIKDLIKEKEASQTPSSVIKSLPPVPRYHNPEPVYRPTTFTDPNQCPYIPKRPHSECYSAPPSECQDIGYADPLCSPGSLCCFDGCINLCWRNPNYLPATLPLPPPPSPSPLTFQYSTPIPVQHASYTPEPKKYGYSLVGGSTTSSGHPVISTTPKPPSSYLPPKIPSYSSPDKKYVPSNAYRASGTVKPVHTYDPPAQSYIPPLENPDAHPHQAKSIEHSKVTLYPPPSSNYRQPSISFLHKGLFVEKSPLQKYSTMQPPTKGYINPKESKSIDFPVKLPAEHYLPPPAKSAVPHHMISYQPPEKSYIPPAVAFTPAPVSLTSYHPPPSHVSSTIKPPTTSYLPPQLKTTTPSYKDVLIGSTPGYSDTYKPPDKSYIPPVHLSQNPFHKGTPLPHQNSYVSTTYEPPARGYVTPVPHMSTSYAPPSKEYLPPSPSSQKPPHSMSHLSPPGKQYLPPSFSTPQPPHSMSHLTPPEKGYLPPVKSKPQTFDQHYKPPSKEYLLPQKHEMSQAYLPPSKEYIPPSEKEQTSGPPINYSPPSQGYLPPKDKKPDYMTHMKPPNKDYGPPKHMTHMAPPSHPYEKPQYAVCPDFTLRERHECHNIQHQCWSPGVPDADCPDHGLCCFDGCSNICSDYKPAGFHVPSHSNHLVPGHEYIPSPGHQNQFHHRTLGTSAKSSLAPMHETEKIYHLVESVPDLPSSYLPPERGYLPPPPPHSMSHLSPPGKDYLPPVEKNVPSYNQHYSPPSKGYLPPPIDKHIQSLHPPEYKYEEGMKPSKSFKPPDASYLPPNPQQSPYEYEPPKYEYLPPKKDEKHPYASYLPPNKDYIPPPIHEAHAIAEPQTHLDSEYMHPPTREYLPPVPSEQNLPPSPSYSTTTGKIFSLGHEF